MSKKKIKKKYWVARDKTSNELYAYLIEPERKTIFFSSLGHRYFKIPDTYECLFDDVTWENSPKIIKVKIKRNK